MHTSLLLLLPTLLLPSLFLFLSRLVVVPASVCVMFKPCPISELVLMFCSTAWQFVNVDASDGSHPSRHGLLRFRQRDDIHDFHLPRAVPTVQATSLPGNWQYSQCLAYVFFAFLCTCNTRVSLSPE